MARSYRRAFSAAIFAVFALAALVCSGAGAEPTTTGLDDVLARIRDEIFVGIDPGDLRAVRAEGTIEMGGTVVGSLTTIAGRDPRAMREISEISGARQVATVLGEVAWLEDTNGMVRAATGDELTTYLLGHHLFFHRYLEGATEEFDLALDGDVIVIRPAEGHTRTLRVGHDFVPREFEQRQLGVDVTTRFSDWRRVGGVLFPFTTRQSTGDPQFDITVRTTEIELLDRLPLGAIPRPEVKDVSDFAVVDPARAADIEFALVRNLILLEVRINEAEPSWFLLDTGAGATVISTAYAETIGVTSRGTMEARGAGGSEVAGYAEIDSMSLPGIELGKQTVVTVSLDVIATALAHPVDGILGYDFLSRCAVEIDYGRRRLAIHPSGEYRPPPGRARVPLRLEANVPRIEGILEGEHRGSFILDTGNTRSLLLHSPFVRATGLDRRGWKSSETLAGIGGRESFLEARIESLALGDVEFRDVPAMLATSEEGIGATGEAIGNIGAGLFEGGVLAFDYSEGALWIEAVAPSASER
jgi:predicted aspartyl protease